MSQKVLPRNPVAWSTWQREVRYHFIMINAELLSSLAFHQSYPQSPPALRKGKSPGRASAELQRVSAKWNRFSDLPDDLWLCTGFLRQKSGAISMARCGCEILQAPPRSSVASARLQFDIGRCDWPAYLTLPPLSRAVTLSANVEKRYHPRQFRFHESIPLR